MTILVVDDEPQVLRTVDHILARAGFRTLLAANAVEAFELFDEYRLRINLVLSDVVMPGMDGFQLASCMTIDRKGIPIVLMSGYNATTSPVMSKVVDDTLNGFRFLSKPFLSDQLIEIIEKARRRRRKLSRALRR